MLNSIIAILLMIILSPVILVAGFIVLEVIITLPILIIATITTIDEISNKINKKRKNN